MSGNFDTMGESQGNFRKQKKSAKSQGIFRKAQLQINNLNLFYGQDAKIAEPMAQLQKHLHKNIFYSQNWSGKSQGVLIVTEKLRTP